MEMTKETAAALRRPMTMAAGAVALALAGCASAPRMLSRPVTVQAGGLDCVGATLVRLGYTITDGDRPTGFVRGERQRLVRGFFFFDRRRRTDVLWVSQTASEGSEPQLNVTASRWKAPTRSVKFDADGGTVRVREGGGQAGPSDEALTDAERLLERCAGVSGGIRVR